MDGDVWRKFFRGFLGLDRFGAEVPPANKDERPISEPDTYDPNFHNNLQVFTDPLEVHRFFEQQMEDMFRNFGQMGRSNPNSWNDSFWPEMRHGVTEPSSQEDQNFDRDIMLKHDDRIYDDTDFDERRDEDKFKRHNGDNHETDHDLQRRENFRTSPRGFPSPDMFVWPELPDRGSGSSVHTFSFSKSTRSVQLSDGSIETEERIRNPDGSETVTVHRRLGNQETVIQSGNAPLPPPPPTGPVAPNLGDLFGHGTSGGDERAAVINPPPGDKNFASIFSKFFGQ